MSLEDRLYPLLSVYDRLPAGLQRFAGTAYRLLPRRFRLGARYAEFHDLAEEASAWSREEMEAYQLKQLRTVLIQAGTYCPFYQKTFARAAFRPENIRSAAGLAECPFLTKNDLIEHLSELVSSAIPKSQRLYTTTGGSTGVPVGFYLQKGVSRPKEQAFLEAMWRRAGYFEGARLAVIRGHVTSPRSRGRISSYDATRNWLLLSSSHLTDERLPEYLEALEKFRPDLLHVYPSAALQLAEYLDRVGQPWRLPLRGVLCGSERLTLPQKRLLERTFQCRVYRWYGHAERVALAGEGMQSELFYFFPQYGLVEFGPPDDEGLREVIGTSFHNLAMPLIRYRTGDYVRLAPEHDSTREFWWPAAVEIAGREQEFLISREGRRISLTAFNMHDETFDHLYAVQFFQEEPGIAELRYVAGPAFHNSQLTTIEERVRRKLGDDFQVTFRAVPDVEKTSRGKHRWLVSRLLLGMILLLLFSQFTGSIARGAELVVRNAVVHTVETGQPEAEAFAVDKGRFIAVGRNEDVSRHVGPDTKVLDLAGKTIVPGFIDAHLHPRPLFPDDSRWAAVDVSPGRTPTMDQLIAALRRKAGQTPAGQWVLGGRYQETKLGRHPTRHDLDQASTNHPILITHSSGHQSVCNTLALRLAKVDRATPDPPGGKFVRDENGEATGLVQERAASVVRAAGPASVSPPEGETIQGYRACFQEFIRRGITSIHVAGTSPANARLLTEARSDEAPIRLYIMLREAHLAEASQLRAIRSAEAPVRFGGIKLFHGNSLSGQTCWLSEPYAHRADYYGIPPSRTQDQLNGLILSVHREGLQACVHSNGDREIEMLLTAFEHAFREHPRTNHRHRIEHCSVVNEKIVRRIQELGLVVVPHSYLYEHGDKMEAFGEARWNWMHPARSLLDVGAALAGHSDYPVSAAEPLLRIQDHVLRQSAEGKVYGPLQRITPEEALRVWTLGGAYASFAETSTGSIKTGKLADFVVLESDPAKVPPERIKDIKIEQTFIGGKRVFAAP